MYGSSIGGPWTEEDVDLHIRIPLIPALLSTTEKSQPAERSVRQLHLSTALNYRHFELAHKVNVFMFEAAPYVFVSELSESFCVVVYQKPGEFWTSMLDCTRREMRTSLCQTQTYG